MRTARLGRYTAAMPSRASPLPQRVLASRGFSWPCLTCGSWLACDADGADDAVWQVHRSDAIASKPAPTKGPGKPWIQLAMPDLWEPACLRCGRCGWAGTPQRCHREQARSHKGSWQAVDSVGHADLWEPACLRCGRCGWAGTPQRCHREQARSHKGSWQAAGFCWQCLTCGSWLACDAGDAVWQVHRSDAIASKPAPTKDPAKPQDSAGNADLWELACLRCGRRGLAGTPQRCHREQARSHTPCLEDY
jgi:hypothetical protein